MREHFDRLVDRISVLEQAALATGDGFSETKSEPAAIDALLDDRNLRVSRRRRPPRPRRCRPTCSRRRHDIPIPTNDRVLRYVELFQGRLREFLTEGLSRGAQYLPMIQATFRAEGLPLDLAYIPLIESAFKPSALSRAKARGVWQFMRGTALENGLQRRLVSRRARRSDQGHPGRGEISQDALRDVRRLAPRDGVVQRRTRAA